MASHEEERLITSSESTSEITSSKEDWTNFALDRYQKLDELQRNEFLDRLLNADGSILQLIHLNKKVAELLRLADFIYLLPPELSELIFSYLDAESLLRCCQVSSRWNRYVSQLDTVWKKECERLGMNRKTIETTRKKMNGSAVTKRIYQRRAKLMKRMKIGTAFCRTDLLFHEKNVTAVWYFDGKIYAGCGDETISIWDATTCRLLRTIVVDFSPTCIKSDCNNLLASSNIGTLTSWKQNELRDLKIIPNMLNYGRHSGSIFSFDFNTKLDLLVSGSSDKTVKLFRLSSARLITTLHVHDRWVIKVLLISDFNPNCCFLSMQWDALYFWSYDPNDSSVKSENRIEFITNMTSFYTPELTLQRDCVFLIQQNGSSGAELLIIDARAKTVINKLKFNLRVKKLLAMGDRYICFILPKMEDPNFVVLDLITSKPVARLNIPQSVTMTPNLEQICFCDDLWLNGFGFDNDGLPLIAVGLETGDICLFKWSL